METLFLVKHGRVLHDDVYENKFIGWYSSRVKATEGVERSKVLEGFRDHPECYLVVEIEVDEIYFPDGFDPKDDVLTASRPECSNMTMVYEIKYARDLSDDVADVKFVGVFSTREKANEALEEVKKLPGFAQYPECLLVTEVEVDLDHWTYGFFTPNDL